MGLFGNSRLPPMLGPISGYGGGTFNMDGTQATPVGGFSPAGDFGDRPQGIDQAAAYAGPKPKGGLFGSGVKWQQVMGAVGDALLAANGNSTMPYTMMQAQKQSQERTLQRADQQRQRELQDQISLYDYKRANPEPANDTFTRALAAAGIQPGTPEYMAYAKKRAGMLTNPVQLIPDGYGGVNPVRPYGEEEQPPAPVGRLTPYSGGPMQPASGGFSR